MDASPNLFDDIRNCPAILEACNNIIYATQLTGVLTDFIWQKQDVFWILKDAFWSTSYRESMAFIESITKFDADALRCYYIFAINGEQNGYEYKLFTVDLPEHFKKTFESINWKPFDRNLIIKR
jgi:hypothetical protein